MKLTGLTALALAQSAVADIGIVVARYKEPLEPWVPVAKNAFVYDKGGIPNANDTVDHDIFRSYVELPNIGREGHTHLTHITRHYDDLQEIMIFSQANPFDLLNPVVNTTEQMVEIAQTVDQNEINPFNPALWHDTDDWSKINWTDPKESLWMTASQLNSLVYAPYTPAQFWSLVFGQDDHPPAIRSNHGGIFAVRRETILSQPLEVYERALQEFEKANVVNPEMGFFWERFWAPCFSRMYWLPGVEHP